MLLRTCDKCGHSYGETGFFKTKSILFPDRVLPLCKLCVAELLSKHKNDLKFADKLCQWADIPFNPNEWIELYENNGDNTFEVYHMLYNAEERQDISWLDYNQKWVEAKQANTLDDEIQFFSAEKMRQLKLKWGPNYDEEEINYLEQLLTGLLQTQNITGKLQMDQAIKLCKISLIIDQKIRAGENFKDELANYDKLIKTAEFTPKNAKNANDFDTAGEIFAYLEKIGWTNKYYDGVDRDIVDKTMKNIQAWVRHLYVNDTGISEDIDRKIEALKLAQELENQVDNEVDKELDKVDSEAYSFEDEDFEPEI